MTTKLPRGLIFAALLAGVWPPTSLLSQTVDTLVVSLPDAERMALEGNPLLRPAMASLDLSNAQKTRANRARYLPDINLRNVWGPIPSQRGEFTSTGVLFSPDTSSGLSDLTWFTQVDLDIVQPLYTFGKIGSRIDAAGFQVDASRAALRKTESEIRLQVQKLYWGVVLTDELGDLVRSVNELVADAEEKLQAQYDDGSATQTDMNKFTIFQFQVRSRSREVEAGNTKARSALRAILGIPDGVPFRVEATSLEPLDITLEGLASYTNFAMTARPEVSQLQAGINARQSLVRAAEADSRPSLFLAGQLKFNESPGRFDPENPFARNQTNFLRPGLVFGINWNLNFFQNNDKARIERYEMAKLEAQVRPLELMVQQQVQEAYLDAMRAREDVEDGRGALRASENLLRAELQTFDIGLGSIDDVIDAFQTNVEMTIVQLQNIAELNTLIAELSQRVGRDIR